MSEAKRKKRARREAQQEKKANEVVTWIFAALIILGIAFAVYATVIV